MKPTPIGVESPYHPLLAIEGLTVSFDGFKAVDDLNLYVNRSEVHVVIGPNGAGKTTVLDLICGKTRATSGSIQFKNKELTKMQEHDIVLSGVGRKFQTPSIYENLSVFENLEVSFPRGPQGLRRLDIQAHQGRNGTSRASCSRNLFERFPVQAGGSALARTKAMARNRHVVDARTGAFDARRAGRGDERIRTRENGRTPGRSARAVPCW